MKKFLAVMLVVMVGCFFVGCKDKTPAEKGAEALKKVEVPDAPDKVVLEAAAALKEGNLIKIYAMLPDSYQKDVQTILGSVTAKMDKEIYEKVFTLLPKVLELVKKEKEKLPVPPDAAKMVPEGLALADEFVKLLETSKLNTYEGFKGLDVAGFLAEHGKGFYDFGWKVATLVDKEEAEGTKKMLDTVKAELKGEIKDDAATVLVTIGDDQEEMAFVKVEGKWIPKDLAEGWAKGKDEALKSAEGAMKGFEESKERVKAVLKGLEQGLEKGDLAALLNSVGPMMMGGMGGPPPAREPAPEPEVEPAPEPEAK